jgi:hypothetical protein
MLPGDAEHLFDCAMADAFLPVADATVLDGPLNVLVDAEPALAAFVNNPAWVRARPKTSPLS